MGRSKKDLDRDMMFRKIMPALADNPYSDPVPAPMLEGMEEHAHAPAEAISAPAPAQPFRRAAPLLPEPDVGEDPLAALQAKLFARDSIPSDGQARVATTNLMENMVLRKLDAAVRKFNCCGCDRCRRDIVAFALNLLPPRYVVADVRHVTQMEECVEENQVMGALIKAVLQVRSNPRH